VKANVQAAACSLDERTNPAWVCDIELATGFLNARSDYGIGTKGEDLLPEGTYRLSDCLNKRVHRL